MKTLSAQKSALTKEIRLTTDYLNDLLEMKEKQGSQFFYEFENRKCERWMLHGEFFFPSTIRKVEKEIEQIKSERAALDAPTELTKELYVSPVKEQNEEKYGNNTNQCICCYKPIKNIATAKGVHMNTDWKSVNPRLVTEENCLEKTGAGSQGLFYIGNECANKMKGFTIN